MASPCQTEAIVGSSHLVAECVIAPEMTKLLKLARSRGKAIHTGMPMLTAQMELMLRFMSGGGIAGGEQD
ncbi:hypothetical protein [Salinicola peritrichatus]|uniref:hypothetical protein n=1 Tax=Salinicola peritrichatus TaxID=1267424 RepID=UPI000DA16E76|nr:hypothetical protein [Salinicola peritrichatus]